MMVEVPAELEEQMSLPGGSLTTYISSFAAQVEVAIEIRLTLEKLQKIGHVDFAASSFVWELPLFSDAVITALRNKSAELKFMLERWQKQVAAYREKYYFLNFFTMLELLRLSALCEGPPSVSAHCAYVSADISLSFALLKR